MPEAETIPPDHRTEQRQRILKAAADCFVRDGFHGSSMQKICAEAQMSPGALYRYFPSKESIIAAIVESERVERAQMFDSLSGAPSLIEGLIACMSQMIGDDGTTCAKLGPEIMAESARNPKLQEMLAPFENETWAMLQDLMVRAQTNGEIDPAIDLDDLMTLLFAMGDGILLNHQIHPGRNIPARLPAIGRLITRMIAPAAKEP